MRRQVAHKRQRLKRWEDGLWLREDSAQYLRVGELGPNSTKEELDASFTLRDVVSKARVSGRSAPVGIGGMKINP